MPRALLALALLLTPSLACAQRGTNAATDETIRQVRSRNFLVTTDLSAERSAELLEKLERMIGLVSAYFGKPNRQPIECFVVEDLTRWPADRLPAAALDSLRDEAGVTLTVKQTLGARWRAKGTVYATADENLGIPQHEAVHAYCHQTFGGVGPVWYSEGVAELGNYWRKGETAVQLPDHVLRYLTTAEPQTLNEIVNGEQLTGDSGENYAWRWALAHLLAFNPNYSARFRPLGLNLMTGRPDSFEQAYGAMRKEILFEYDFFLDHLENGLEAERIAWDWKTRFIALTGSKSLRVRIDADRGWQPSRAVLAAGDRIAYAAGDEVTLSEEKKGDGADGSDAGPITADGGPDGSGRLVGAMFDDEAYALGEEFELGRYGEFTAPSSGRLMLRVRDDWGSLGDNDGRFDVRLKVAGVGKDLTRP